MNISEAIATEQARYLYRNSLTYMFVNLLVTAIFSVWFWGDAAPMSITAWMAATGLFSLYRGSLWWRFRRLEFSYAVARRWLRYMFLGPATSGALWGVASFLLLPSVQPGQQFAFLCTFVLYATAAVFNYSAYYPTYVCVFLPFGVAIVVAVAAGMTTFHPALAGVLFLFVVAIMLVARRFNRIFLESLKLRFENVELVQQLTVQKEAAEAANLAKSRFLAAASHDLRQPMHAINLYLGTLAGFDLPRLAGELLTKARQCGQTMDEMFRALLDMSRLDASAVQPEIGVFPIGAVLDHIRVQFEPEARAKGLDLSVAHCSAFVRSDSAMVERILRNLVANAVRYTERGKILVGCRRNGASLRLAVYDTGPGIPVEKQRAIFEEFYQLGNPERDRSKGMGLGLAIVERLVRLLSIPVTLVSQPGRGSVFAVDLPRSDAIEMAVAESLPKTAERTQLAGLSVVVIDDEEPILDATRALLEHWGCSVVTATSGAEAIASLAAAVRAPDFLICDYRLRGEQNGIHAVTAIRAEFNESIPALLITGDTAPERLHEIGASDLTVLYKPIDEETLKRALLRLVEEEVPN